MGRYVITGGAGGMGQATARRLAADGHATVLIDVSPRLEGIAAEIDGAVAITADLSDPAQCDSAVEGAFEAGAEVDGALLAAGVTGTFGPASRGLAEFDRVMAINARSTLLVGEAVASRMADSETPGSLVLISSSAAHAAIGQAAYSASKAAVEAIGKELAVAYAQSGIRVNVIAPGLIDTEMAADAKSKPEILAGVLSGTLLGRLGRAEEIAGTVAFLLSADASYITGSTLLVDGGLLAS